jgi:hypothetical protein
LALGKRRFRPEKAGFARSIAAAAFLIKEISMTVAVCVKCGAIKHGAFNPCVACGERPASEDDLVYSLVLTDHYFPAETLQGISASMLAGKPRPSLPPEQEAQFREMFTKGQGAKMLKRIGEMNRA